MFPITVPPKINHEKRGIGKDHGRLYVVRILFGGTAIPDADHIMMIIMISTPDEESSRQECVDSTRLSSASQSEFARL
jgi:hypothetical protein